MPDNMYSYAGGLATLSSVAWLHRTTPESQVRGHWLATAPDRTGQLRSKTHALKTQDHQPLSSTDILVLHAAYYGRRTG